MIRVRDFAAPTPAGLCVLLAGLLLVAAPAGAQDPQPAEPDKPAATAPAQRSPDSGPFTAFGRLIDQSITGLASGFKDARESVDEITGRAGEVAKGATGAIPPIPPLPPPPGVVRGREFCPPAGNGAPDCRIASAALCRAKGFKGGRSIDMQTEQVCPAEVWVSGRQPAEGECRLESYVTRALCQ